MKRPVPNEERWQHEDISELVEIILELEKLEKEQAAKEAA